VLPSPNFYQLYPGGRENAPRRTTSTNRERSQRVRPFELPTKENLQSVNPLSRAQIQRVFSLLDIRGDGKLNFLNVKSAIDLMRIDSSESDSVDDFAIRAWIRDHDSTSKGFVDWDDFLNIYNSAKRIASADNNNGPDESSYRFEGGKSASGSVKKTNTVSWENQISTASHNDKMVKMQK
jgi:hypothetical protein